LTKRNEIAVIAERIRGLAGRVYSEAAFRTQSALISTGRGHVSRPLPERVMLIILGGIGDAILFSPVIDAIRKEYPKAAVDVLVRDRAVEQVYSFGFGLNRIIRWSDYEMGAFSDVLHPLDKARFAETLAGYDLVIHSPLSHHSAPSRFALLLNPGARHVGFAYPMFSEKYTVRIPLRSGFMFDLLLDIPCALGIECDYKRPLVRWPKEAEAAARAHLKRAGLDSKAAHPCFSRRRVAGKMGVANMAGMEILRTSVQDL